MVRHELEAFNEQLFEYVQKKMETEYLFPEEIFTEYALCLLKENAIDEVYDSELVSYQNSDDKVKINAFVVNTDAGFLTIVVSKYSNSPSVETIGKVDAEKILKSGSNFYRYCLSDNISHIDEASSGYRICELIREMASQISTVNVILLTNNFGKSIIPESIKVGSVKIVYDIWDIERLSNIDTTNHPLTVNFSKYMEGNSNSITMIKTKQITSEYDCYVGIIPGLLLAHIYKDKRQLLMEQNVRAYLSNRGKVNHEIEKTLQLLPEMFMAYNNGISTIADSIVFSDVSHHPEIIEISEINGWQIVNGGQTTVSLFNALIDGADLDKVFVQMKLTVIHTEKNRSKIIDDIALYANTQNPVKFSDFTSNNPYHIRMNALSKKIEIPNQNNKGKSGKYWYYENARGDYLTYTNGMSASDKKKFDLSHTKISKTEAARAWMLGDRRPWSIAKGLESNFKEFTKLFSEENCPIPRNPTTTDYIHVIVMHIIYTECYKRIKYLNYGDWRAPHVCYTAALLIEYGENIDKKLINENDIWEQQTITIEILKKIDEIAEIVWDYFTTVLNDGRNLGQVCKKEGLWGELKKLLYSSVNPVSNTL